MPSRAANPGRKETNTIMEGMKMNHKLMKEAKDFIREVMQYAKDHEENPAYQYPQDDSAHIYYFDGTSEFFSATSNLRH